MIELIKVEIRKAQYKIDRADFLLGGCKTEEEARGYELEIVALGTFMRIARRAIAAERRRQKERKKVSP